MNSSHTLRILILLFPTLILSSFLVQTCRCSSNIPSSYSWTNLRTDTVEISYSFSKSIWYGGTGYLHIKTNGPGVYSDTKTATATVTISDGSQANVYVCGDDRNGVPSGWSVEEKYLRLYVDGKKVYELGREYWWAKCYSKAATIGPGTHEIRLVIYISVRVSTNGVEERDVAYASMDIKVEGSGIIQADNHTAEAVLDGSANHFFVFKLPNVTGVGSINWRAKRSGVEKTGSGAPGSTQTVSFSGVNRDSWLFKSPVVIRVGGEPPSVEPMSNYSIDAVYDEGSQSVGIHKVAVAISNGDEVGFSSGKYLVTDIEYLGLDVTGHTAVEGLNVWANSGSNIRWAQRIRFYNASGWIVEDAASSVETGACSLKKVGGGAFSKKVIFSSKNRSDELILTIDLPQITLHFDSMRAEPIGLTDLGLRRIGETVELKVKTYDCLGEYSRVDVYRVSETSPGIKSYTYAPVTGVYRGITSTVGGNVTFTIRWVSFRLEIHRVSGAIMKGEAYWARSGSPVTVTVSASFSDNGSPAENLMIRDSEGREVSTGSDGTASFSYAKNDCELYISYIAIDEHGNPLSNEVGLRIVFSRIVVEIVRCDGFLFKDAYYACNDAYASLSIRASYSHNKAPVSGAISRFSPSGSSTSTNTDGYAVLNITGSNKAYEGYVEVSDSIIDGNAYFRIIFTSIILEPSRSVLYGTPGEDVEVTVLARLTFNNTLLNGVRVKWIEGDVVKETPALFKLKIPKQGSSKARFEAISILPCVKPCEVLLVSNAVKFGDLDEESPKVIANGLISKKCCHGFFLNIMDLLNITIPKVVWCSNGSIAYGVKIGVVSSNGTVVRTGVVSKNGVSFNWTESKPGVYYYIVKPLDSNIGGDVLNVKAVFTAFNITGDYIVDLNNGTHVLFAKAYWAHNCSPAYNLPVYTTVSKRKALSSNDGVIQIFLNDSDYNKSCVEKLIVLKNDPHPSGIWRIINDCYVRIIKLDWSNYLIYGDQYGLTITANLTSMNYSLPLSIKVEGYTPEISSSLRILGIKSDNSSMTIFIGPSGEISLVETFALRIEEAEYDGVRIRIKASSLSRNLSVRNVKIKILNSSFEKYIGDLYPEACFEAVLEVPNELRTNPIAVAIFSENTIPCIVKVWRRQEAGLLLPVSVIPLLIALSIRLRNRRVKRESGGKAGDNSRNNNS